VIPVREFAKIVFKFNQLHNIFNLDFLAHILPNIIIMITEAQLRLKEFEQMYMPQDTYRANLSPDQTKCISDLLMGCWFDPIGERYE
jgi:hypothetical protein